MFWFFFFTPVSLTNESKFLFDFTFLRLQYLQQKIPQGFQDYYFSNHSWENFETFIPLEGSIIIPYVGDLLVASKTEGQCKPGTLASLQLLASLVHEGSLELELDKL